jgi:hypothetical protein
VTATVDPLRIAIATRHARFPVRAARLSNSCASGQDKLRRVPNDRGELPSEGHFPETWDSISLLPGPSLFALSAHDAVGSASEATASEESRRDDHTLQTHRVSWALGREWTIRNAGVLTVEAVLTLPTRTEADPTPQPANERIRFTSLGQR